MAVTFVASLAAASYNGGPTSAFDTTGADAIILSISSYTSSPIPGITDSKGNVYTSLTAYTASFDRQQILYCLGATTGSGHTIILDAFGTAIYTVVCAFAFAGVLAYESQNGVNNGVGSPQSVGSVTPSGNGALLVTGIASDQAKADTVPTGFTGQIGVPFTGGNNFQGTAGYLIQTTAAAINPAWTWVGGAKNAAASVAVFTGGGGGGATARTSVVFVG